MKAQIERFPKKYKTQQQRFLYIIFSRYPTFTTLAVKLGFSRQFLSEILRKGELPLIYASFLADVHSLPTALFDYKSYVFIKGFEAVPYERLVTAVSDFFEDTELDYIVKGAAMPAPHGFLHRIWKGMKR